MNIIAFIVLIGNYAPGKEMSPYSIAKETGEALQLSASGDYALSKNMSSKLTNSGAWAILIDNNTCLLYTSPSPRD